MTQSSVDTGVRLHGHDVTMQRNLNLATQTFSSTLSPILAHFQAQNPVGDLLSKAVKHSTSVRRRPAIAKGNAQQCKAEFSRSKIGGENAKKREKTSI